MLVAAQVLPQETTFLPTGAIGWWESLTPSDVPLSTVEEVASAIMLTYREAIDDHVHRDERRLADPARPKLAFSVKGGQA